ncbi:MAG: DUF3800 domain-containing protein [Negativicutes bacterium]
MKLCIERIKSNIVQNWQAGPTVLDHWPDQSDYIIFIDESGGRTLKNVRKAIAMNTQPGIGERHLAVAGIIIERNNFPEVSDAVMSIKNKYWDNGIGFYKKQRCEKRVCFHSEEVRKRIAPFDLPNETFDSFTEDLSVMMTNLPYNIIAAGIDKYELLKKYGDKSYDAYNLCSTFILERFCKYYLAKNKKRGSIVFEARGGKEDRNILRYLVEELSNGAIGTANRQESSFIDGVYFNPKRCQKSDEMKSYFALEIADLAVYPIMKYARSGNKDRSFIAIEEKFHGWPNYSNKGLKIFP